MLLNRRYKILASKQADAAPDDQKASKAVLEVSGLQEDKYRLGHTKACCFRSLLHSYKTNKYYSLLFIYFLSTNTLAIDALSLFFFSYQSKYCVPFAPFFKIQTRPNYSLLSEKKAGSLLTLLGIPADTVS